MYNYKKSFDCETFMCTILENFLIQKFVLLSFRFPKNFDALIVFLHNSSHLKDPFYCFLREKSDCHFSFVYFIHLYIVA